MLAYYLFLSRKIYLAMSFLQSYELIKESKHAYIPNPGEPNPPREPILTINLPLSPSPYVVLA